MNIFIKKNKKLKFEKSLVELILSGEKTSTWRLFDDKDLKVGDNLELLDYESKKIFAKAKIVNMYEKKLGEIEEEDFDGHEKFSSKGEMLETYKGYYGDKVSIDTVVKIIRFEVLS